MQPATAMRSTGGRAASRERRAQLAHGKTALPPAAERTRIGAREAAIVPVSEGATAPLPQAPEEQAPASASGDVPVVRPRRPITGALFSGDPCQGGDRDGAGSRVSGDTPCNVARVTGTQRGAERCITGTPYYRPRTEADTSTGTIERVAEAFSVRSSQLEAQLAAAGAGSGFPSSEGRITGAFARGEGKITGNQEFHFVPRPKSDGGGARSQLSGEGRTQGPRVTGGAWDIKSNVTGTEDYIAAARNPSERAGGPHAFAGARLFKGKGRHDAPTHHVTGMVGWSPKAAARVTVSGGGQG